jgi:hypothetical protein
MHNSLKHFIIYIAIICSTVHYVDAQNKFNAGIIAGITTTQVHGDTYEGYDKLGLSAGGFVNRAINEKFSLQLELLYTQKGSKHNPDPDNFDFSFYEMSLSYAEIPLLLRFHFRPKLIAEAGISYGRLLSSEEEDAIGILYDQQPFKKSEYSVHGGFEMTVYRNLKANFRFEHSIISIRFNSIITGYYSYGGQFNNVIHFMLRYNLNGTSSEN